MRNFFIGKKPLWQAFWGIFIGGYFIMFLINGMIAATLFDKISLQLIFILICLIMSLYFFLSIIIVWKCSSNVEWGGWSWIARMFVLIAIIMSVYSSYLTWNEIIPAINKIG